MFLLRSHTAQNLWKYRNFKQKLLILRMRRIELRAFAWEANMLPLHYIRSNMRLATLGLFSIYYTICPTDHCPFRALVLCS